MRMYSEVEHAVPACELETDEQGPLRGQRSYYVEVCHTDLTHHGDGRSSCSMSEEDLSPEGRSDQGTAQEAALDAARWTTQGPDQTADLGWKFKSSGSGMG